MPALESDLSREAEALECFPLAGLLGTRKHSQGISNELLSN